MLALISNRFLSSATDASQRVASVLCYIILVPERVKKDLTFPRNYLDDRYSELPNMKGAKPTKRVFVTVGTTSFDALISHVLHPDTLDVLEDCGYSHLTLQVGRGAEPAVPHDRRISVEWYRLKDSILPDIESSSLVISHAGAGSCLEVLGAGKPLVVVVNQVLMGNHQTELADKLQSEQHAATCYPQTLCSTLKELDSTRLKPFPPSDGRAFATFMEKLMGLA